MNRNHWIIVFVVTFLFGMFSVAQGQYVRESDVLLRVIGAFVLNYLIASSLTQKKKIVEEG